MLLCNYRTHKNLNLQSSRYWLLQQSQMCYVSIQRPANEWHTMSILYAPINMSGSTGRWHFLPWKCFCAYTYCSATYCMCAVTFCRFWTTKSALCQATDVNPRPDERGGTPPPYTFPPITRKRNMTSPQTLCTLPVINHCTPWLKEFLKALICRPQMTSEWRHVLPISVKNRGARESSSRIQF